MPSGLHAAYREPEVREPPDTNDVIVLMERAEREQMLGQHEEALHLLEHAFRTDSRNVAVIERMLVIARHIDDPVRISRCLATLSQLVSDPQQQANYLIEAAIVARDRRGQPEKATFGLLRALELDPDRLDAFLALTEIYSKTNAWDDLEQAYRRMIHLHSQRNPHNPKLLSKLWRKLALLIIQHSERYQDAGLAIDAAIQVDPEDVKNHGTRYDIFRQSGDWEEAAKSLHGLIAYEHDGEELRAHFRTLGALYLEHQAYDAAFCALRTLSFLDAAKPDEQAYVDRYVVAMPRIPKAVITERMWREAIFPEDFPHIIGEIYGLVAIGVLDLLKHDLSYYKIRRKDRMDLSKPLLFNNLMRQVSSLFGLPGVPDVYARQDDDGEVTGMGLFAGLLEPPAFIVDRDFLSGVRPFDVAFVTARLLALQRPDLFLASISTLEQLNGYLMAATAFARPDSGIQTNKSLNKIIKALGKKLAPHQQAALKQRIDLLVDNAIQVPVEQYMILVDDVANRLAFLVADDLTAAAEAILRDDEHIATVRPPEARLNALIHFSVSAPYLQLRRALRLAIDS